jgi:hypothetical protein
MMRLTLASEDAETMDNENEDEEDSENVDCEGSEEEDAEIKTRMLRTRANSVGPRRAMLYTSTSNVGRFESRVDHGQNKDEHRLVIFL